MEIVAQAKNVRVSPRKVRLLADMVKKLSPAEAVSRLRFLAKSGSKPILKTLQSAIANAENNLKLSTDTLRIKNILVDEGLRIKRQDKSRGTRYGVGIIQKRSAHIKVILEG